MSSSHFTPETIKAIAEMTPEELVAWQQTLLAPPVTTSPVILSQPPIATIQPSSSSRAASDSEEDELQTPPLPTSQIRIQQASSARAGSPTEDPDLAANPQVQPPPVYLASVETEAANTAVPLAPTRPDIVVEAGSAPPESVELFSGRIDAVDIPPPRTTAASSSGRLPTQSRSLHRPGGRTKRIGRGPPRKQAIPARIRMAPESPPLENIVYVPRLANPVTPRVAAPKEPPIPAFTSPGMPVSPSSPSPAPKPMTAAPMMSARRSTRLSAKAKTVALEEPLATRGVTKRKEAPSHHLSIDDSSSGPPSKRAKSVKETCVLGPFTFRRPGSPAAKKKGKKGDEI
ncbi:hypothetical protein NP233_g11312 [Leucocoprinus birnbaumii]|uniref:Uncharacterized protein n=1 Tax=Leucocoprinus birnbaumii TaxID=56174 RepID=A0AAD5VJ55_9AGAR|nr:hypothetical protein NP233_g11312 [Leucocoprinus birnbaumii]